MPISKRSGPTLDFTHEGRNSQSKMSDIEIENFQLNKKIIDRTHFEYIDSIVILIVYVFIHVISEYFQIQDGRQIHDFY